MYFIFMLLAFMIPAEPGRNGEQMLAELVPAAKKFARAPVSNYQVGVALLGGSGNIYLGVNLEFPGFPLNQSVHAEQFALALARSQGETEVVAMALSAAPCGHCRQFYNEIGSDIKLILPKSSGNLSTILPHSFGPHDLGIVGGLLSKVDVAPADGSLKGRAIEAAQSSYAPYTQAKSGVALKMKDGSIFTGCYLENAAYNPSLPPLQAALISLVAADKSYNEIVEVVLVEAPPISHEMMTKEIVKSIAPKASFKKYPL